MQPRIAGKSVPAAEWSCVTNLAERVRCLARHPAPSSGTKRARAVAFAFGHFPSSGLKYSTVTRKIPKKLGFSEPPVGLTINTSIGTDKDYKMRTGVLSFVSNIPENLHFILSTKTYDKKTKRGAQFESLKKKIRLLCDSSLTKIFVWQKITFSILICL